LRFEFNQKNHSTESLTLFSKRVQLFPFLFDFFYSTGSQGVLKRGNVIKLTNFYWLVHVTHKGNFDAIATSPKRLSRFIKKYQEASVNKEHI